MGKINDRTEYPEQSPVSDLDYLSGTDASTLETKSFTIGDIVDLGFRENTITKSANYTLSLADNIIYLNSSSAFVVTLPTATNGKSFNLKNIGVGSVVIPADQNLTVIGKSLSGSATVDIDFELIEEW